MFWDVSRKTPGHRAFLLGVALIIGTMAAGAADTPQWTDAALRAPGAAEKLIAASEAATTLGAARSVLEQNAPRLPQSEGRRKALASLARLLELAGDTASAADVWSAAAFSEQGRRDDPSLLESARCLAAVGEFEKASAAVRTVLLTGKDPQALFRARLLSAYIAAFVGDSGAPALLKALVEETDYAADAPAILFILDRICGDGDSGKRLIAQFPSSPEARVLARSTRIDLAAFPLWFLSPGRAGVVVAAPVGSSTPNSPGGQTSSASSTPQSLPPPVVGGQSSATTASGGGQTPTVVSASEAAEGQTSVPPSQGGQSSAASTKSPREGQTPILLQVGLFKSEANARALADRLVAKKFTAVLASRKVNGEEYWSVTVDGGSDPDNTTLKLKDAGFESFPLF